MNKIVQFSMIGMLVAGLATSVSAGEVNQEKGKHTGVIADFLGKTFKPAGAPTGAPTGAPNLVPQGDLMVPQHAPAGAPLFDPNMGHPNTVPHPAAPYMGNLEGSHNMSAPGPQGVPHFGGPNGPQGVPGPQGAPFLGQGAPSAPHYPQGAPTPCAKGAVPLG